MFNFAEFHYWPVAVAGVVVFVQCTQAMEIGFLLFRF